MADNLQSVECLPLYGSPGVRLDDFVWQHSSDGDCNSKGAKEEA